MTQLVKLARNMTNYSELWAEVSNPAQRPRPLEMWRGSVDTFPNSWVIFGGMKSEEQTSLPSQGRVIVEKGGLEEENLLLPGLGKHLPSCG